ncbi:Protein OBERON 1 [Linum grandiflorum]
MENKPNNTKESNECTGKTTETPFTPFHLRVVPANESGKGLPYAPENWPNPGDMWGWKVGKRLTFSGYHIDRNLYLPKSLQHLPCISNRVKNGFASKLAVRMFIEKYFPGMDIKAFFASFVWKVPSSHASMNRLINKGASPITRDLDSSDFHVLPSITLAQPIDLQSNDGRCKAGNKVCISLEGAAEIEPLPAVPCDICCDESGFCRDCCCIICCKTVSPAHVGYSYVKCHAIVTEACFCSHVAHLECALRTYMAGTVGGSIGLDAEYFCRCCDAKTDLVPHVMKLLQTCKSMDSRDEIQKMLNLGICILRGTRRNNARDLLKRIELAATRLKHCATLEDVWKVDEEEAPAVGHDLASKIADHSGEILALDSKIDGVFNALRDAQEFEYKTAEEQLVEQKEYVQNLY